MSGDRGKEKSSRTPERVPQAGSFTRLQFDLSQREQEQSARGPSSPERSAAPSLFTEGSSSSSEPAVFDSSSVTSRGEGTYGSPDHTASSKKDAAYNQLRSLANETQPQDLPRISLKDYNMLQRYLPRFQSDHPDEEINFERISEALNNALSNTTDAYNRIISFKDVTQDQKISREEYNMLQRYLPRFQSDHPQLEANDFDNISAAIDNAYAYSLIISFKDVTQDQDLPIISLEDHSLLQQYLSLFQSDHPDEGINFERISEKITDAANNTNDAYGRIESFKDATQDQDLPIISLEDHSLLQRYLPLFQSDHPDEGINFAHISEKITNAIDNTIDAYGRIESFKSVTRDQKISREEYHMLQRYLPRFQSDYPDLINDFKRISAAIDDAYTKDVAYNRIISFKSVTRDQKISREEYHMLQRYLPRFKRDHPELEANDFERISAAIDDAYYTKYAAYNQLRSLANETQPQDLPIISIKEYNMLQRYLSRFKSDHPDEGINFARISEALNKAYDNRTDAYNRIISCKDATQPQDLPRISREDYNILQQYLPLFKSDHPNLINNFAHTSAAIDNAYAYSLIRSFKDATQPQDLPRISLKDHSMLQLYFPLFKSDHPDEGINFAHISAEIVNASKNTTDAYKLIRSFEDVTQPQDLPRISREDHSMLQRYLPLFKSDHPEKINDFERISAAIDDAYYTKYAAYKLIRSLANVTQPQDLPRISREDHNMLQRYLSRFTSDHPDEGINFAHISEKITNAFNNTITAYKLISSLANATRPQNLPIISRESHSTLQRYLPLFKSDHPEKINDFERISVAIDEAYYTKDAAYKLIRSLANETQPQDLSRISREDHNMLQRYLSRFKSDHPDEGINFAHISAALDNASKNTTNVYNQISSFKKVIRYQDLPRISREDYNILQQYLPLFKSDHPDLIHEFARIKAAIDNAFNNKEGHTKGWS